MKKYVISRGEGPKYNGSKIGCLTPNKSYEVLYISYQTYSGIWKKDIFQYNPKNTSFYIKIKEDDNGNAHSIWNDYFLSTEESRELKINKLGIN